jgi:ubiquinone/menaquinone biosynthesis C-methylase UbiE
MPDTASSTNWRGLRGKIGGWILCSPLRRLAEILLFGDLDSSYLREVFTCIPEGNETVLDLGAGSELPEGKVICVDLSDEMLAILRKRANRKGIAKNIRIVKADASSTGIDGETCDLAVSSALFHELEKPEKALAEMVRVVKPGGSIVVADFRDIRMPHGKQTYGPVSVEKLTELFHEEGLIDTIVYPVKRWVVGAGKKFSIAA